MPLEYEAATAFLEKTFAEIGENLVSGKRPPIDDEQVALFDTLFESRVQAYRETLLGCALARLQDRKINIRLPYINQGTGSYNGRTLDERVINPFLHKHRIPCTRGPFLSVFRRSVPFEPETEQGLRDKVGFRAFLRLIGSLEAAKSDEQVIGFVRYLLYRFALLREAAQITLSSLQRISLDQFDRLIGDLLATPSGGRLPVVMVVAALQTLAAYFERPWTIEVQDINAADGSSGAAGDITVREDGHILFAAEITERPLSQSRVVATFHTKITPNGLGDYLFFVPLATLAPEARSQARQYFAQGHEINFVEIRPWLIASLATMGKRGREIFNTKLLALVSEDSFPRHLKVAWNERLAALTEG